MQVSVIVFYNLGVVAVILIAGSLPLSFIREGAEEKSRQFLRVATNFSAGIFLTVSFLHMIPTSIELIGEEAGLFVLAGYLVLYILEQFAMVHPCEEATCDYHRIGLAAFFGLSVHSLLSGFALGSAMLVPGLGIAVLVATLVHKGPEAFSLGSLLIMGNRKASATLVYLGLFSVMVPLGCLLAYFGLTPFGDRMIAVAVAISAGTFLQLATGDLLPTIHAREGSRLKGLFGFLAGIALMAITHMIAHVS